MFLDSILTLLGLATLLGGGDLLLRGSVTVAEAFGMSRLLIGLTVVSLGTSAPEMAICLDAAMDGKPEIALGNIVGSNVANVLLILGITSLITPIVVESKIIRREVPIMIGISLFFLLLVSDQTLSVIDGSILLGSMIIFLLWQFRLAQLGDQVKEAPTPDPADPEVAKANYGLTAILIFGGAAMLWLGAGWLVQGASGLASSLGVSQLVIGLTVVAIGSSAPEIATSILAARRGYPEMAIGSVLGSNIANLLLVAGGTTLLAGGIPVPSEALEFDLPVMILCAIACLPIFSTGHQIVRWEGAVFLMCYIAFSTFLFFRPTLTTLFPAWRQMVWPIAIPLIIATLIAIAWNWRRSPESKDATAA